MSNSVKQISVLQNNGTYVSQPIGADARNVDIDATHTLADKVRSWDSKADSSDLGNYVPVTAKGMANGVATLDAEGKIPEEQIPGGIQPTIEIDPAPAQGSENAVSSGGVYTALGEKVNRVNGKGLSTNDYTNEEKTKLEGIESGAEVNVIESISVKGVPQTITNKSIDLAISSGDYSIINVSDIDRLWKMAIGNLVPDTWLSKNWYKIISENYPLLGFFIWTDGNNIYLSNYSSQYILNKNTSNWDIKVWNGLTSFYGVYIWTYDNNIYYSEGSSQYILNKVTSTWEEKIWDGLTDFEGAQIWLDGENIYYSNKEKQYILDKSTNTWNEKIWNGLTSFYSNDHIWTDGENIYYSSGSSQYILDI